VTRQGKIEQNEVERRPGVEARDREVAVARLFDRDLVTEGALEKPAEDPAVTSIVFDDEDVPGVTLPPGTHRFLVAQEDSSLKGYRSARLIPTAGCPQIETVEKRR
jgi:hypothetical protein